MKLIKNKIVWILVGILLIMFLSNDFWIIDVEKTAIITAVGIDYEQNNYVITAQIAVPEATDQNTENSKAVISGKGATVGSALKNIGNISGWFPKMSFCNLIIVGQSVIDENIINVLDYFSKTLRIQDSATVVYSRDDAKKLLQTASPLDNISSFALQKVILKDAGFDKNIAPIDIKRFCIGYYSYFSSSYMPIIEIKEQSSSESQSGNSSGNQPSSQASTTNTSNKGNSLFDATKTALFKNGFKVGELDTELTTSFNLLFADANQTIFEVIDDENDTNYLLTIIDKKSSISLDVNEQDINVKLDVDLYCKMSDKNKPQTTRSDQETNFLSQRIITLAQNSIKENLNNLVQKEKETMCDFLGLGENLYRFHNEYFDKFKDNLFSNLNSQINIRVHGQL